MPSFGFAAARFAAGVWPDFAAGEEHPATPNPSAKKTASERGKFVMMPQTITVVDVVGDGLPPPLKRRRTTGASAKVVRPSPAVRPSCAQIVRPVFNPMHRGT